MARCTIEALIWVYDNYGMITDAEINRETTLRRCQRRPDFNHDIEILRHAGLVVRDGEAVFLTESGFDSAESVIVSRVFDA